MVSNKRPAPFVLISTNHGTMIVNRNDCHTDENGTFGVGFKIMSNSEYEWTNVEIAKAVLSKSREFFGDGVIAIDCGANIGCLTVSLAKHMHGWGYIMAFEAQRKIFYALAGNIIINNCLNADAHHFALGSEPGFITIPEPNYTINSSFGSLELRQTESSQYIGQDVSKNQTTIQLITIDSLNLSRLDLIKIDVEGMEFEVLHGAKNTILTHKPAILIEYIKNDPQELINYLQALGYILFPLEIDFLAIHSTSPIMPFFRVEEARV
ncbi:MAG: FkbM family methyltransferase [Chlamydiae bacterium]|nr:FkbM family methyltransferase [Chlamydiota bacterium]